MVQSYFSHFLISALRTCSRKARTKMFNGGETTCSRIFEQNLASVPLKCCFATQTQQPQLETPTSTDDQQYEQCTRDLNTLQTNAVTIRRSIFLNTKQSPLSDMERFIKQSGINLEELEKIPLIHVSGTKGKGSTCALTESILRQYGVRTGFFSSPHLVSVTERFRINGKPITKQRFVRSFRQVYDRLRKQQKHDGDMPAYFKFLTILCFHIFMEEKVDVFIMEVGIGGELDCTNVIRNTETVGITSLGLEHTQLLGNTLTEIAWQKAGIIKLNSDVFTSVTQPECLEVIRKRAKEMNASLHIVPAYQDYLQNAETAQRLKGLNEIVQLNGSLAIQLAYNWLRKHRFVQVNSNKFATTTLTREVEAGLLNCQWPGRCQLLKLENLNFHIDGAHTLESIVVCSDWFKRTTAARPSVLIFNTTGDRDSAKLLEILHRNHEFAQAYFVPNIASGCSNHNDNTSVYGLEEQLSRTQMHTRLWQQLAGKSSVALSFNSILDSLQHIRQVYGTRQEVDVLVTGSLHLVGATMAALNELSADVARVAL